MNPLHQPSPDVYSQIERNARESKVHITPEKIRASAMGLLAAVAIANGNIDTASAAEPKTNIEHTGPQAGQRAPTTEQGVYLRDVEELPGWNIRVSKKERAALAQATVKILSRPKKPPEYGVAPWSEVCTGSVITIPGKKGRFVMTTSHCDPSLDLAPNETPDYSRPNAVDVVDASLNEFAIADPKEYAGLRAENPIAFVYKFSVHQRGIDLALMKVRPNQNLDTSGRSRPFNSIKPVRYKPATNLVPGQQVGITSIPEANGNRQITTHGRYLGTYTSYSPKRGYASQFAIVGVKPPSAQFDPFNYSASGSSSIVKGGGILPGLSGRINLGYPNGPAQYNDINYFDPATGEERSWNWAKLRSDMERTFRVDMSRYNTIGYYNIPRPDLMNQMIKGFAHHLPPREALKGGTIPPPVDVPTETTPPETFPDENGNWK